VPDPGFGVTDLADAMAMGRSTLYRRLAEDADVPPSALITRVRMEEAQALLAEGEPVTQVAYAVGYESLSAFSTAFEEAVGTLPSTYMADGA
jgi:AraC-like DNA-binding protein